jgi:hypothetical protein
MKPTRKQTVPGRPGRRNKFSLDEKQNILNFRNCYFLLGGEYPERIVPRIGIDLKLIILERKSSMNILGPPEE